MHTPPESTESEAFHQPFSWLPAAHQADKHAQFYALTVDVCKGIKTCADLIQLSNSDRGTDTPPTLDVNGTERLLRLVLTSSQMLADIAAERIDQLE